MPTIHVGESPNILLRSLGEHDRNRLAPYLTRVSIKREQMLVAANKPIKHAYFPEGGVASITSSADNIQTEIGIFGREGMSATVLLLGADRTPHDTFIQVNGSEALRIDAADLLAAFGESSTLRQAMLRYIQTLVVQIGQGSVANARQQIEGRLARWLLMCHDRVDGDELMLTHEFMGMMIGAQRSGVTLALHVLEGTGVIRSTRGRVTILARDRLEDLAGDSYGLPENEYRRLIGPFGKTPAGTA